MNLLSSNPHDILVHVGLLGTFIMLFAESGVAIGFFLPGDSLLLSAGLLASQGQFSIWWLIVGGVIAAIAGAQLGYYLGWKYGPSLFNKPNSAFFNPEHLKRAEVFYARYGVMTIVLSRFIPVVRAFTPILAGVGRMNQRMFLIYNVVGAVVWITLVSLLGYFIGSRIPNIDHYILPVIALVIILSILASVITSWRVKKSLNV